MQPLSSCIFPPHASTTTSLFTHISQHLGSLICENYPSTKQKDRVGVQATLVQHVFDKLAQKK